MHYKSVNDVKGGTPCTPYETRYHVGIDIKQINIKIQVLSERLRMEPNMELFGRHFRCIELYHLHHWSEIYM